MSNYTVPMHAENYYHVFNRTNNKEILFREKEDRKFFLKRYKEYLVPYLDTFAYNLLDNHFHLSVRVKSIEDIVAIIEKIDYGYQTVPQKEFMETAPDLRSVTKVIERQFSRLFTSYSMKINTKHKRNGNLFHRPFKRVEVTSNSHFIWLIYYINANTKKHKIKMDFQNHFWCSYQAILSNKPTNIMRQEVLDWFGGREDFIAYHEQAYFETDNISYLIIED